MSNKLLFLISMTAVFVSMLVSFWMSDFTTGMVCACLVIVLYLLYNADIKIKYYLSKEEMAVKAMESMMVMWEEEGLQEKNAKGIVEYFKQKPLGEFIQYFNRFSLSEVEEVSEGIFYIEYVPYNVEELTIPVFVVDDAIYVTIADNAEAFYNIVTQDDNTDSDIDTVELEKGSIIFFYKAD